MGSKFSLFILTFFTFVYSASAHNQDPPLIRKTLKVVFEKFNASVPSDYIKSNHSTHIAGKNVEYYFVKDKESKVVAVIGKIEVQEILYALGIEVTTGKIVSVSKRGKELGEEEIKSLEFIHPTAEGLRQLAR